MTTIGYVLFAWTLEDMRNFLYPNNLLDICSSNVHNLVTDEQLSYGLNWCDPQEVHTSLFIVFYSVTK